VRKENAELENDHKTKGNDFKNLIMIRRKSRLNCRCGYNLRTVG
jgi:hypothetical protein